MVQGNERLLELLTEKSFLYSQEPTFKLASGKMSSFYVNCKKTTYDPEGINLIGKAVFKIAEKYEPSAIGGLTLGADPIAVACAGESFLKGKPMNAFVVRKTVKEHGTKVPIEGNIKKGDKVIVIEDVITTGGSAIIALDAVRECGLEAVAVIALVDREEGGREAIEAKGVKVESLFTKEEIFVRYKSANGT